MTTQAPWTGVFEIFDEHDQPIERDGIPLIQIDHYDFLLHARLRYLGDTDLPHLDAEMEDTIRDLTIMPERTTDLASVPKLMRWFINTYGTHTPAALFHDRYSSSTLSPIPPIDADRYFRAMLKALGMPIFKRYIMWTAVAGRTRWISSTKNKILIGLWVLASVLGLAFFVGAVFDAGWASPRWLVLILAALAPLPASLLWGRQKLAALIAAAAATWLLPVVFFAMIGVSAYWITERTVGRVIES